MRPMLASRGTTIPATGAWVHEVKWDGWRSLAHIADGRLRLTSRNGKDLTRSCPELEPLGRLLPSRTVLDAEIVVLGEHGTDFPALADRMGVREPRRAARLAEEQPVVLMVFDVLRLHGRDITAEPLESRREQLAGLEIADDHWQTSPWYDDGDMLFVATQQQGLEGVMSKRRGSRYEQGVRSQAWLKFAHRRRHSYVIGGWRPERGSQRLGAVLVGEVTPEGLVYRGRVGSGISGVRQRQLIDLLRVAPAPRSPFVDEVPTLDADGTQWVEPAVVVDVEALGLSPQGRLRQPVFRGVRADLSVDVLAELGDE